MSKEGEQRGGKKILQKVIAIAAFSAATLLGFSGSPSGLAQAEDLKPPTAVPARQVPGIEALSYGMGLNVDYKAVPFKPEELRRIGTTWVRMALTYEENHQDLIKSLRNNGIETVGVIERESIHDPKVPRIYDEGVLYDKDRLDSVAGYYAAKYPELKFWQVGNEPDDPGEASWGMKLEIFKRLLTSFNEKLPSDKFLIAGGLSTGDPSYLEDLDLKALVDAMALHPYGVSLPEMKSPSDFTTAESLIERYRYIGLPILITEAGVNHTQFSPEDAAKYTEFLLRYFKKNVLGVAYFCMSDWMVDNHGLLDKQGNPKPSLDAYMRAASGNRSPAVEKLQLNPLIPIPSPRYQVRLVNQKYRFSHRPHSSAA